MPKETINSNNDIDEFVHQMHFDYETGALIYISSDLQLDYIEPSFQNLFPVLNFSKIKEKILKDNVSTETHFKGREIPFEFTKIKKDGKDVLVARLLVDSLFFGYSQGNIIPIPILGSFLTAYVDCNFKIIAHNKNYKTAFSDNGDHFIGRPIYHNIINYKSDVHFPRIKKELKEKLFWYSNAVIRAKGKKFVPYILLAYDRPQTLIKTQYEVHFFPLEPYLQDTFTHYDAHSNGSNSIYSRNVFEGIVNKYLTADDNDKYLLFFDINDFKSVNDYYGHDIGDHTLKEISRIIGETFKGYIISRYGGDEYTVYIDEKISQEEIVSLIKLANQRICADLGDKFRSCRNYLSVGISKYKENGVTLNELINAADTAMYVAKREKSLYKFCYEKD